MQYGLAEHFKTYEEIKKLLDEWIISRRTNIFFIVKFTYCQKNKKKL